MYEVKGQLMFSLLKSNKSKILLTLASFLFVCSMAFAQEQTEPNNDNPTSVLEDNPTPSASPEPEKAEEVIKPDENDEQENTESEEQTEENPEKDIAAKIEKDEEIEIPEVSYDLEALPFPTRRMHELILAATKTGDIEKLRPYIGVGDSMTLLSLSGFDGDPITFLKQETGDEKGHEILAILEEVLEAGYVHIDKGTDQELYVWPYFFAYPIDKLSDPQMVELFRIVTYGDFQDMKDFGGYIFYRVGITPSGRWSFFVAGD